jgi:arylformamidase
MPEYLCLSFPLSTTTPAYGNGQKPILEAINDIAKGDSSNKTKLIIDSHIGTHVDFPKHFIADGKSGTDYLAADFVFSEIEIIEIDLKSGLIDNKHLVGLQYNKNCELLLIKTLAGNNRYSEAYWQNGPGMASETALFLKEKMPKLKAIGFNFISLTAYQHRQEGRLAHKAYLGENILIIEDMNLVSVDAKTLLNKVVVAPLLFEHCDGAPVYVLAEMKE